MLITCKRGHCLVLSKGNEDVWTWTYLNTPHFVEYRKPKSHYVLSNRGMVISHTQGAHLDSTITVFPSFWTYQQKTEDVHSLWECPQLCNVIVQKGYVSSFAGIHKCDPSTQWISWYLRVEQSGPVYPWLHRHTALPLPSSWHCPLTHGGLHAVKINWEIDSNNNYYNNIKGILWDFFISTLEQIIVLNKYGT